MKTLLWVLVRRLSFPSHRVVQNSPEFFLKLFYMPANWSTKIRKCIRSCPLPQDLYNAAEFHDASIEQHSKTLAEVAMRHNWERRWKMIANSPSRGLPCPRDDDLLHYIHEVIGAEEERPTCLYVPRFSLSHVGIYHFHFSHTLFCSTIEEVRCLAFNFLSEDFESERVCI